ncbi:PIN domain-containing protein [Polaromonas sp. CG_9.11]|uniref:PIN domain-containing protein n=1 Tax=Polaromonas sp. CG_9.11 TaxID=2787730 RepID=UPI0018C97939|nr:type II toxin-antitoxin system VapC family toxin [Polaromonas sp. CG_9.11]MBG6077398.1 putative nucleic-acid-binding protein [Polaromonas sp. CG_9.11]
MIGLDTNVLVRYIMQDDAPQAELATALIESLTVDEPGFVPLVALIELVWVLSSAFDLVRSQVVQALETLLLTKEIQVENAEVVWRALRLYRASAADFADCLIERSAAASGCSRTMTFDRGAVKHCAMTLVQ